MTKCILASGGRGDRDQGWREMRENSLNRSKSLHDGHSHSHVTRLRRGQEVRMEGARQEGGSREVGGRGSLGRAHQPWSWPGNTF